MAWSKHYILTRQAYNLFQVEHVHYLVGGDKRTNKTGDTSHNARN